MQWHATCDEEGDEPNLEVQILNKKGYPIV